MAEIFHGESKKKKEQVTVCKYTDCSRYAQEQVAKKLGIADIDALVSEANQSFGANDVLELALKWSTLQMSDVYSGTAICHDGDEPNPEVGENVAKDKASQNFIDGYNKAILRWQIAMMRMINSVSPETADKALEIAKRTKANGHPISVKKEEE